MYFVLLFTIVVASTVYSYTVYGMDGALIAFIAWILCLSLLKILPKRKRTQPLTQPQIDEVKTTLSTQGEIPALQKLRAMTNMGLKEAKQVLEGMK